MALTAAPRVGGAHRPHSSRQWSRAAAHNKPAVAARSSSSTDMAAAPYAILRLGGVRQMLQEGLLYTCPKSCLLQGQQLQQLQQVELMSATSPAAGNGAPAAAAQAQQQQLQEQQPAHAATNNQRSYVLSNVLGLHNGREFTWGKPYLPNTLVEVEVVEEFQGPTPRSSVTASAAAGAAAIPTNSSSNSTDSSLMTIYRVKHIKAAV